MCATGRFSTLTPAAGAATLFGDPVTSAIAGLFGVPLAGYTGVLVANTAIPVWNEARTSLPFLFIGSAIAGAAQVLKLLPLNANSFRAVNNYGIAGSVLELAAGLAMERQTNRVPVVGKPLREGLSGTLWNAARILTGASLLLSIFGRTRNLQRAGAVLGTAGALALRFGVFHAGKASVREPRATFHLQRNRQ